MARKWRQGGENSILEARFIWKGKPLGASAIFSSSVACTKACVLIHSLIQQP